MIGSAKLEAEEFVDDLLDNHIQQFMPQPETSLDDFSCNIPKELLFGFIPTHRDIRATFSNGVVTNLSNVTRRRCRPSMMDVDGEVSVSCVYASNSMHQISIERLVMRNFEMLIPEISLSLSRSLSLSLSLSQISIEPLVIRDFDMLIVILMSENPSLSAND